MVPEQHELLRPVGPGSVGADDLVGVRVPQQEVEPREDLGDEAVLLMHEVGDRSVVVEHPTELVAMERQPAPLVSCRGMNEIASCSASEIGRVVDERHAWMCE